MAHPSEGRETDPTPVLRGGDLDTPGRTTWELGLRGVTRYQWLVLAIASAGWVFDVFEGQIYVAYKRWLLPALASTKEDQEFFFNLGLAAFLAGGAAGGLLFGMMADRWGRRRTMALTILMYSAFTGLTALVRDGWQLAGLRFFVGMGVGGEWAVAAAAVAEVFPPRARPAASGIFHASSVLGTYLAVAAGYIITAWEHEDAWRYGFVLGVLPALLVFWVRATMRDPESWQMAQKLAAQDTAHRLGRFTDLFSTSALTHRTLVATSLAVIGLATFWGAHVRAKDVVANIDRSWEFPAMFLVTTGGGIGLLAFAPISQRLGRRPAFWLFHLGGFVLVAVVFLLAESLVPLLLLLPVFGFFTLGMHAGYAVYFPELFPTRMRGTGAGFCFNMARVVAGPVLLGFGWLQKSPLNLTLPGAMLLLGSLFLVGAVLVFFAPETRGQPLPE
jgi:MFS family permease